MTIPLKIHPSNQIKTSSTPFLDVVLVRSVLNDLPLIIISLIVGIGAFGLGIFLNNSIPHRFESKPLTIVTLTLIASWVVVCAVILFRRFNVRYLIAQDGIKALRGILSNSQVDAKLEYYQIRGTEIRRSVFERLIGTGDLVVQGSSGNETEVAFKGIYDPYRYQKLVQERHRLEVQNSKTSSAYDRRDGEVSQAQAARGRSYSRNI